MGVGGRILTPLLAGPSYRAVEGMVVSEGSWVSAEEEPLQLPIGGGGCSSQYKSERYLQISSKAGLKFNWRSRGLRSKMTKMLLRGCYLV